MKIAVLGRFAGFSVRGVMRDRGERGGAVSSRLGEALNDG